MTVTATRTRECHTRVEVTRPPGGGAVAVSMSAFGPADRPVVRPMLLAADEQGAKVSLVPEGALLLAADEVRIDVAVGPGARLELVEPAGTLAHPMFGGAARWDVNIDLAPTAVLMWLGEPFVVASGARVSRRTLARVGWGACLALRELVVLGRHGEDPGELAQSLEVIGPSGAPMLAECLDLGPRMNPLLIGQARAIGTVVVIGRRLGPTREGTRCELEAEGTMVRAVSAQAHEVALADTWQRARSLCS